MVSCVASQAADLIAFRGLGGAFDHVAFHEFAQRKHMRAVVFNSTEVGRALTHIENSTAHYELYGFSQGAVAVGQVLRKQQASGGAMPRHVITIGAHSTTDIDFAKFGVPFENYLDDSGRSSRGPGTFLKVPHMQMQSKVNEIYPW